MAVLRQSLVGRNPTSHEQPLGLNFADVAPIGTSRRPAVRSLGAGSGESFHKLEILTLHENGN